LEIAYKILTGLAVFAGVIFTLLVLVTGKGDAMSGGASGVRTSFKGKASFEDKMYKLILWIGIGFMALMILLNFLAKQMYGGGGPAGP
jgi:preprotein translocase subunit SecG